MYFQLVTKCFELSTPNTQKNHRKGGINLFVTQLKYSLKLMTLHYGSFNSVKCRLNENEKIAVL